MITLNGYYKLLVVAAVLVAAVAVIVRPIVQTFNSVTSLPYVYSSKSDDPQYLHINYSIEQLLGLPKVGKHHTDVDLEIPFNELTEERLRRLEKTDHSVPSDLVQEYTNLFFLDSDKFGILDDFEYSQIVSIVISRLNEVVRKDATDQARSLDEILEQHAARREKTLFRVGKFRVRYNPDFFNEKNEKETKNHAVNLWEPRGKCITNDGKCCVAWSAQKKFTLMAYSKTWRECDELCFVSTELNCRNLDNEGFSDAVSCAENKHMDVACEYVRHL